MIFEPRPTRITFPIIASRRMVWVVCSTSVHDEGCSPSKGFDGVVEWKRSIFRHKALKRGWEVVILQNLLDKIALKHSPRARRISRTALIEYFGYQVTDSDRARTCRHSAGNNAFHAFAFATGGGCAVFLGNEEKVFVIFVDQSVGAAIAMFKQGTQKERPLTHDLVANILRALGAKIERVIVNDLKRGTYF